MLSFCYEDGRFYGAAQGPQMTNPRTRDRDRIWCGWSVLSRPGEVGGRLFAKVVKGVAPWARLAAGAGAAGGRQCRWKRKPNGGKKGRMLLGIRPRITVRGGRAVTLKRHINPQT